MKLLVCLLLATAIYEAAASSLTCNCGWVNSGRIVNGQEAPRNKYPWVVSIQTSRNTFNPGFHFCGGTILTPRHIITAAHCTHDKRPTDMIVKVGAHEKSYTGQAYDISQIIVHEYYNNTVTSFDISLLVTAYQMPFNAYVGPACLPNSRLTLDGQTITAMGWGHVVTGGPESPVLREVQLKVVNIHECRQRWRGAPRVDNNLCTYEVLKSTCQGDSGGPLVWLDRSTNRYNLIALVSFGGIQCNGPLPGVHTDVSLFLNWINYYISATVPGSAACTKV